MLYFSEMISTIIIDPDAMADEDEIEELSKNNADRVQCQFCSKIVSKKSIKRHLRDIHKQKSEKKSCSRPKKIITIGKKPFKRYDRFTLSVMDQLLCHASLIFQYNYVGTVVQFHEIFCCKI